MTTLEILEKARDLIAEPEKWRQKYFAGTKLGIDCMPESTAATCFCLGGALMFAASNWRINANPAVPALGFSDESEMYCWNDAPERTHADILARLDAAISKLKSEQAVQR